MNGWRPSVFRRDLALDRGVDSTEAQGVDYVLDGHVLEPGVHRSKNDVTISAVPQNGYAFVDGAVTEWSSAFTAGLLASPTS